MAYQDGSRVALRLTEIQETIQEVNAQLQALNDGPLFIAAEELVQRERELRRLTDRLQGLHAAWQLQHQLASEELRKTERECADGGGKKMKYYGYREIEIRFLGGLEIKLWARYHARNQVRADKGKGAYFGLLLLGVHDHCSPALASEVTKLAAAMNSLQDARVQLQTMGVNLSKNQMAGKITSPPWKAKTDFPSSPPSSPGRPADLTHYQARSCAACRPAHSSCGGGGHIRRELPLLGLTAY